MDFESFKERYKHVPVIEYENRVDQQPMVSVCVQTYQHEAFIKDCLEGILMQVADFPVEILVGEDDSSDGTRDICIAYAQKYPDRIRLFLHDRRNNIKIKGRPTGNFNAGYNLFNAKGKYIALCEGDDFWTDPFKLQKQVDFLETHPDYVFSVGKVKKMFEKSKKISEQKLYGANPAKNGTYRLKDYFVNPFSQTSTFLFRKTLKALPEWAFETYIGDQVLVAIVTGENLIYYHDDFFSVYRINESSATNNIDLENYKSNTYFYMDKLNELTGRRYNKIFRLRKAMINARYWALKTRDYRLIRAMFYISNKTSLFFNNKILK